MSEFCRRVAIASAGAADASAHYPRSLVRSWCNPATASAAADATATRAMAATSARSPSLTRRRGRTHTNARIGYGGEDGHKKKIYCFPIYLPLVLRSHQATSLDLPYPFYLHQQHISRQPNCWIYQFSNSHSLGFYSLPDWISYTLTHTHTNTLECCCVDL